MAKREKIANMKLEQTELKPIVIGAFESRKKNSIGVIIILAIFIGTIFFLPQISNYVNNLLHPKTVSPDSTVIPSKSEENDQKTAEKNILYSFNNSLEIKNDDVLLNNFKIDNDTIVFNIINNSKSLNINDLNYYLELYNQDKTLLERVKIVGENISIGANKNITRNINKSTALNLQYISLVKKTDIEYPEVTINMNAEKIGTIICSRDNEKVTYKFNDNKLIEVTSEVNHLNTEENYNILYSNNNSLVSIYNAKVGVSSNMFLYTEGFNITTIVNLNEAERTYIFNADTFNKDTEPKIVKFEMEAQNFTCK